MRPVEGMGNEILRRVSGSASKFGDYLKLCHLTLECDCDRDTTFLVDPER